MSVQVEKNPVLNFYKSYVPLFENSGRGTHKKQAFDGIRTRDLQLKRLSLYQLSYEGI